MDLEKMPSGLQVCPPWVRPHNCETFLAGGIVGGGNFGNSFLRILRRLSLCSEMSLFYLRNPSYPRDRERPETPLDSYDGQFLWVWGSRKVVKNSHEFTEIRHIHTARKALIAGTPCRATRVALHVSQLISWIL